MTVTVLMLSGSWTSQVPAKCGKAGEQSDGRTNDTHHVGQPLSLGPLTDKIIPLKFDI